MVATQHRPHATVQCSVERVGDGHCSTIIIAAMAAVKRGSSLCEGCGTSNGNRALVCKGCGKPLSTKTKRAKRPEHVPEYSSNVTLLLDAELKAEIATAISVRVRPQGPDYRCFATKDVQWNPSIADTTGEQHFVRYSEVSSTQGLPVGVVCVILAVEYNEATFSELSFAARWQRRLSRG